MEIVSCVAGLASLAIEVATITTRYITAVKIAPQEIVDLSIQTKALSNVLEQLETVLQNDVQDRIHFKPESSLSLVLEHCRVQLDSLFKKLEVLNRPDKGKLLTTLDKLKWPLNRKECLETAQRLHQYTQAFHFCLSLNHCEKMSQSFKDVEDLLMQQKANLDEASTMLPEVPNQLAVLAHEIHDVLIAVTDVAVYFQGLSSAIQAIRLESDGRVLDEGLDWLSPLDPSKTQQDIRSMA